MNTNTTCARNAERPQTARTEENTRCSQRRHRTFYRPDDDHIRVVGTEMTHTSSFPFFPSRKETSFEVQSTRTPPPSELAELVAVDLPAQRLLSFPSSPSSPPLLEMKPFGKHTGLPLPFIWALVPAFEAWRTERCTLQICGRPHTGRVTF